MRKLMRLLAPEVKSSMMLTFLNTIACGTLS